MPPDLRRLFHVPSPATAGPNPSPTFSRRAARSAETQVHGSDRVFPRASGAVGGIARLGKWLQQNHDRFHDRLRMRGLSHFDGRKTLFSRMPRVIKSQEHASMTRDWTRFPMV